MGPQGKVKSVDGQTITVYKSAMMNRPQGDGSGEMPADGDGRMNMEDMFTDETVEIQVNLIDENHIDDIRE
ncbi:MAG: hypothetical protein ACQEXQ_13300 [Bacillota bacterium]